MLCVHAYGQAPEPPPAAPGPGTDFVAMLRDLRLTPTWLGLRATLTSQLGLRKASGQETTRSFGIAEVGSVAAAGYLGTPYLAQVSGDLGFVRSGQSQGQREAHSTDLTGGASLSLFPMSRFPFGANFSVTDSRASGESVGAEHRTTRFGIRQSYRTLEGSQYAVHYDRSEIAAAAIGSDVLNVAGASYSGRSGAQSYGLTGYWAGNTGGTDGRQASLGRVTAQHRYAPAANLNVETLALYGQEQSSFSVREGLRNELFSRTVQVATFASWRPEEDEPFYDENRPLLLTGGLRLFAADSGQGLGLPQNLSLSASAGLNYTLSALTRLSANAALTHASSAGGAGLLFTSQGASVSYSPLPWRLGAYTYAWNLSGGGSNATGGGAARQALYSNASQRLWRDFPLPGDSRLTLSASQSAGASAASGEGAGASLSLTHNATATWSMPGAATAQTYVSASASDARSFGARSSEFQLLNLQATRQAPLSALSFWTANITLQGSRQAQGVVQGLDAGGRSDAPSPGGFIFTTSGSIGYQHRRLFGVPRLRLYTSFSANQAQLRARELGDLEAPRQHISSALDARLDYQIGKVDAQLTLRNAAFDGRRESALLLRVARHF